MPLKLAGVPQNGKPISAANGPAEVHHIVGTYGGHIAAQQVFFRLSIGALVAKT